MAKPKLPPWLQPYREPKILPVNSLLVEKFMDEQGISIKQMAAAAGVSTDTIKRIRSGKQDRTRKEVLARIAKTLGVDILRIQKTYSNRDMRMIFGDNDIPF